MALLNSIISTERVKKEGSSFGITMIHYSKLIPSETNNYSLDNIRELAYMIKLSGGVKQNLLARKKTPEEYELIAGHRRRMAVKYLVEEEGLEEFALLPVHVEKSGDILSEIDLIITNCGARERSDWEKMMEVTRLTELVKAMQVGTKEEQDRFRQLFGMDPGMAGGRELRKVIAETLGLSVTKVANLNHINSRLLPELKERFEGGEIGVSVANEAAGLPAERQKELAKQEEIKLADIKAAKEKAVSESDTGKMDEKIPRQMDMTDLQGISGEQTAEKGTKKGLDQSQDAAEMQQNPEERCEKATEQEEKQYPMSDYDFREKQCNALARKLIQCWKPWFEEDFQNRILNVVESEKQIKEKNNRSSDRTWYFAGPDGEMMHANLFDNYIQFWGRECLGNCDWFYLCAAIQRMWQEMAIEEARNRSGQPIEQNNDKQHEPDPEVIDAEFTEIATADRYTPQYFLEKEKKLLDEMLEAFKDENPENIPQEPFAHKRIVVAALAAMVCDLENEELKKQLEEEKPQQPELPVMRNNDQRKAFLDAFHDWPVWFRVPEASEVYYRYDLPDGTALVICEYQYWLEWRVKYDYGENPEAVGTREYLLVPGYHYLHDCLSNRTTIIEKLKEIQKKG